MEHVFQVRGLKKLYSGRMVLDLPELDFREGMITGITGHNGSGKSTLLGLLACLGVADQGRISYRGRDLSPLDLAARREITLLLQTPYLLKRSVRANVRYGLALRAKGSAQDWNHRIDQALDMVGLAPERFASRNWFELSGGEAQRVALAARLVLRPRVLLLDEPTASLDQESAERIHAASEMARDRWGTSVIVVSHDRHWVDAVCDEVVHMADGRVV